MGKDGYSVEGLFGTIHHYDSKGHKIGESVPSAWGGYNNYDARGHKTGETRPGFFGYNNYDARGNKIGSASQGFFGTNHYDAAGKAAGSSHRGFVSTGTYDSKSSGAELVGKAGAAAALERDPRFGVRPDVTPHPYNTAQALGLEKAAAPARSAETGVPTRPAEAAQSAPKPEHRRHPRAVRYLIAWVPGDLRKHYYLYTGSVRIGDQIRVSDCVDPVTVQAVVEALPYACPFDPEQAEKALVLKGQGEPAWRDAASAPGQPFSRLADKSP